MASSSGRDSLGRAATVVAWLVGSATALAQPGVDGPSHGGPGRQGGSSIGAQAMGNQGLGGQQAGPQAMDGRDPTGVGTEQASSGAARAGSADGTGGGRDADQELARAAMARGDVLPLDRILKKATDFVPGDVLDVRLRGRPNATWVYEIRMLSDDGRIRLVVVDATRNTVLEVRRP